ncbi:MAG: 30S ribosomal protein S6 [Planctomycetes bacterium]|nr:30S ribosomal protein S6 [Planctomycetota bacterium]
MERNRLYECMLLLDNREVKKDWEGLKKDVTAKFTKHGVEILSARRWEERRLAYPIQRQKRGTYVLVYFKGATKSANSIRRELELHEPVLRYLMLSAEEVPASAYEPEAAFDPNKIPADDYVESPSREPRVPEPAVVPDAGEATRAAGNGEAQG